MAVLEGNVAFANLDEHEEYQGQSTGKYSLVLSLEPEDADNLLIKVSSYESTKAQHSASLAPSTKYRCLMQMAKTL